MIYLVIILVIFLALSCGALCFYYLRDRERATEYARFVSEAAAKDVLFKHLLNCWLVEKGSYSLDEKVSGAEPDDTAPVKESEETYEDIQGMLKDEIEGSGYDSSGGESRWAKRKRLIKGARRLERGETDRSPEEPEFEEPTMPGRSVNLDADVRETAN